MHFNTFGTITKGGSYPVGLMIGCIFLFTSRKWGGGGGAYNGGQSPVYSIVILLLLLAGKLGRGA